MSSYFVKSLFNMSEVDFKNLRKLYLPLIGPKPYSLITIFYDLVSQKNSHVKIELSKNDFLILSKQSTAEFDESKKILESFFLIDSFIDMKNQDILIELIQPLNEDKFLNNKILQTGLLSTFGNDNYQKWFSEKSKQSCINKKEDYVKTSVKYFDYIDENTFYNTKNILDENRNDILLDKEFKNDNYLGNETFSFTNETKISKDVFNPILFLRKHTMCKVTLEIEEELNKFSEIFENNLTMEYIFNECYKLTKNLNWQYIKKIMDDLIIKGKTKYFDVKNHFNFTSANSNTKYSKNIEDTNKIKEEDFALFNFYEPNEESNMDFSIIERRKNEN